MEEFYSLLFRGINQINRGNQEGIIPVFLQSLSTGFRIAHTITVSALVQTELTERARNFNIVLDDVAITRLLYGAEFLRVVEQKQMAQQEAKRSKFVVAKVKQERCATIIRAERESESAQMISRATKKAGTGLIELRKIEAMRDF
ncbi:prohibitin-3 [Quercus suber]|uniref:Prohibitin n=1 Tax=Quercus suber TaxID=58331 RepID=A0AAW0J3E7_QUESU